MSRRGATKAIVLAYLKDERQIGAMLKYMHERHGLSASAEIKSPVVGSVNRATKGPLSNVRTWGMPPW